MSFQAWRKPSKISGVNFPPRCPHDFETQVRALVRKHNDLIDDLATYQATVREVQTINVELKTQLEASQKAQAQLQTEYDQLKELSEKVASRYEAITYPGEATRVGTSPPRAPSRRPPAAPPAARPAPKQGAVPVPSPPRPYPGRTPGRDQVLGEGVRGQVLPPPKSPVQPSAPPSSPVDSPKPEPMEEASDDEAVLEVES